ncbi:hypothetical protein F7725_028418 [Dissostichus mawsoni]|uniref:DUF4371 domain-containing protein n=1 Tax=Dissostichus mawsoni TaxID=36200 RepID=A0A7J5XFY1_DISMA|nr:hypothetical protein F7725_028418 [Dissostichus mawsoni]
MNNPWATSGFIDLANLSRAIERHGKSKNHIDCAVKLKLFGRVRIDEALDLARTISTKKHNEQVKKNRDILRKLIIAALYLARQEQAFRGHNEAAGSSNRGNFVELSLTLHLRSTWDRTVFSGMSNTIQNDIIESIARSIQDETDKEIHISPFIAVQVDDTSDISNKCQLTVIIRYVNEKGRVRAVHAIHEGRGSLCIAFDKIMTEPGWDKETIAQSASLKQKLEDFDFTFLLGVFQSIFGLTEPLFQVLQSKTVDIKKCQDRIMSTLRALKATRTDETFSRIYEETVKAVGDPVPRRKRCRRGWDDLEQGFNQHQEGDEETVVSFRRLYFQIVDIVLHMTQRFADMEHLNFFRILEHTSFASFCNPAAFPSSELAQLINTYPFFDEQKLRNELQTLYSNRLFHKPPGELIELLIEDDLQGTLSEDRLVNLATISIDSVVVEDLKATGKFYDILYCWDCLLFGADSGSWARDGYSDLGSLSKSAHRHQNASGHLRATIRLKTFGDTRIELQLDEQQRRVKRNRGILKRLINCVVYLGKQELPFRGHDESVTSSNKGNYIELLDLVAEYDSDLHTHLATSTPDQRCR